MKKKILAIISAFLALVTLITSMPLVAFAANDYSNREYYPRYTGQSGSIVTALKSLGIDSSYAFRSKIAQANSITNYKGTAAQNVKMVSLLKSGKLRNPSYKGQTTSYSSNTTSSSTDNMYYPKYKGNSGSIVSALKSIGVNSSFAYREKIAKINSIGNPYKGTANQNIEMLTRLRNGTLIRAEYVKTTTANTHTHSLKKVSNTGDITIKYCSCGYFECKKSGVTGMSAGALAVPLPNGGNLIDLEALNQAVNALGTTIAAGGAAVVSTLSSPYVVAIVVGGVLLYAIISIHGTTLELTDVKRAGTDYRLDEIEKGKFYHTALIDNNDAHSVLIIYEHEMSMSEAFNYVKGLIKGFLPCSVKINNQEVTLGNIYTLNQTDAEKLCKKVQQSGLAKYGGDNGPDGLIGGDTTYKGDNIWYYYHYHLYYWKQSSYRYGSYSKLDNLHIFFGSPYIIRKPMAA